MKEEIQSFDEVLQKLAAIQQTYLDLGLHKDLLSLLLTRSNELFLLIDDAGIIRAANPACEERFGYSTAQLIGQSFLGNVHSEDTQKFVSSFTAIKKGVSSDPIELRFLHAKGFPIWLEAHLQAISIGQQWKAYMVQLREITDRKLIEEHLQLKEKVFENALEGILITDLDSRIVMVNPAFCRITGYSKEEVIGQKPRILKSGTHPPEFFVSMWDTLKQTGKWEGEIWNRRKSGELFVGWATISVIHNDQGKEMYYASIFTEITKRKEEEEKLIHDLHLAKQVQKHVLSKPIHQPQIEIDALYLPSIELGGDMYAWYEIDPDRYGIILLDVVGHGVAASLISMSIRSLLRGLITRLVCPELVMKELNRHMRILYHSNEFSSEHFFTAIYVMIDTKNRVIEYVNAGHPSGLLVDEQESITLLDQGCVPIGLFDELPIKKHQVRVTDLSRILLFTDGIIGPNLTSFAGAINRLQESLQRNLHVHNQAYLQQIHDFFIGETGRQKDDICVVSITLPSVHRNFAD